MASYFISFLLSAICAVAVVWALRRARGIRPVVDTPDDHGAFLAEISQTTSSEDAIKLALVKMHTGLGIDRIVYLRRRGDHFRTEERLGFADTRDSGLTVPYVSAWDNLLTRHYGAVPLRELFSRIEDNSAQAILDRGLNYCYPLFWGGHVHALVLLKLDETTQTPERTAILGSLSQMLSAVSHIESMRQRFGSGTAVGEERTRHDQSDSHPARQVLKLVRHRNSDTVVRRLISTFQSELELERFVCLYEPRDRDDALQVVSSGIHHALRTPHRAAFETLVTKVEADKLVSIHSPAAGGPGDELSRELARCGFRYAAGFPMAPHRKGLIAWADGKSPHEVMHRLSFFHDAAAELVANAESFERIEELTHTDPLTGLYNQRYLQTRLVQEINRAKRYSRTLGLVMIDVDLLKSINDRFGHQAGDTVLCELGRRFRRSLRDNDIIARYGGDEFCVVMPEADLSTCELFMTRMRTWMSTSQFALSDEHKAVSCTVSLGAAVYPAHGGDADKLIFAADMALLRAKENGRNTSEVFDRS